MYTDNLIRTWNFEQQDLLDVREVLYQEALAKINDLEYELRFMKWDLENEKDQRSYFEDRYHNLIEQIKKL